MRERVYRTEAVILRRSDVGEADRLLTLYTPAGKRRVVARGVRKMTSRLAGFLELFTHTSMLLAIGRTFDVITQSAPRNDFAGLRQDLARTSLAYYCAELVDRLTEEEDANPALFEVLVVTFTSMATSRNPDLVVRWFELELLEQLGYRPHLHRCTACQQVLSEQADRFSAALGGMLCLKCAPHDRGAVPLGLAAFKLLRYLQTHTVEAVEFLSLSEAVRMEVEQVLRQYLRRILERDLRSVAFLEAVRAQEMPAEGAQSP